MAKINYGKKKLIAKFEKNGSVCNLPSGVEPASLPPTVKKGYLLCSGDAEVLDKIRSRGYLYDGPLIKAEKCFCTECQKAFSLDNPIKPDRANLINASGSKTNSVQLTKNDMGDTEISCPECHTKMDFNSLGALIPISENTAENHVNKNGAWLIPEEITGRYIFEHRNENDELTRLDDNFMTRATIVYPSGKTFRYNAEFSKSNDLLRHSEITTRTVLKGSDRDVVRNISPVDVYEYAKPKSEIDKEKTIHTALNANNNSYLVTETPNFDTNLIEPYMDPQYDATSMRKFNHYIRDIKLKVIEENFDLAEPVMNDSSRNCMYLRDVKIDSTERNTTHVDVRKDRYMTLMTKYPAAFEYASIRAQSKSINYEFEQKRKAEADPNYTAKAPTEKYKAKLMRDELNLVAEQLCTCDDKVLATIRESKNYDDMKTRLRAISLGDISELDDDTKMNIDVKNASSTNKVTPGKKLKKAFNLDPIATAHNVYTAKKIGLKTLDDIQALNDIGKQQSADLNPAPKRINGKYVQQPVSYNANANAGMVAPIRTRNQMRFMRNFSNTHNASDVLDIYADPEKFRLCNECLNIYNRVCDHTILLDNEKAKDPVMATASHEFIKSNIEDYLQHHSVQEAYINYVTKYGAKTPETINQYVAEIKFDEKFDEIRDYAKEHGNDAAVKKYADEHRETGSEQIPNIEQYIADRIDNKHASLINGKQIVSTKNEKPLFNGRNLVDIHDELSSINQKMVSENYDLTDCYPDEIKAMEKSYPAPDGSGTWSFKCHKNAFDVVNSATSLHNCLGSTHVNNMRYGSMWVMYMENELGHRVAAIELSRNHGPNKNEEPFKVTQFQADHDTSLPERYVDVAKQWLEEYNIDHKNNHDVKAFGTNVAFYGANADYHHFEIDEVDNERVTTDEREKRKQRRIEEAKRLYKYDAKTDTYDFGVKIPEYTPKKTKKTAVTTGTPPKGGHSDTVHNREHYVHILPEVPEDGVQNSWPNNDFGA